MRDYSDIINKERPPSSHPKMDLGNRAKIFQPFDALRGFDLALLTKQVEQQLAVRCTLSEDAQELLDHKLHMAQAGAKATVTYFHLEKMIGDLEVGQYLTETGEIEEVDLQENAIILSTAYIPITDIVELEISGLHTGETEVNSYAGPDQA